MWKKLKITAMLLIIGLCTPIIQPMPPQPSSALCAVVTKIQVQCSYDGYVLERTYTTEEKLQAVLTYLRLLKPRQLSGTDPDMIAGEYYEIRLGFSFGPDKVYYQHSNRFLSLDRGAWQAIDRTIASQLYDLMLALPTDST